jgi:iron complex transport system permease protein
MGHSAKIIIIACSAMALLASMVAAITIGNYAIPLRDVISVLAAKLFSFFPGENNTYEIIIWEVRFPRILLAGLGGMALAMSGAAFQGIFRNPLVEPYVLGISSGAACGAALSIAYLGARFPVGAMAFACAVTAMVLAYGIATTRKQTPLVNLILAGVVVSSIFSALLNLIKTLTPDSKLREITFWTMGGFYTATWRDVGALFPLVFAGLAILWALGWKINVLSMGDLEAKSLGVSVVFIKVAGLGTATLASSAVVSVAGIVSWVGLMVPHAARMIIGPDHRFLIPFAALLGGIFLVISDTIARTFILGEIPISIITSILGSPYLIYLLRKHKRSGIL